MSLRILILASEYPHHEKDKDGIFIQDQAIALNRNGIRADVAFVEPRSVRSLSLSAFKENHFQATACDENGVFTMRSKGWNPWMNSLGGGVVYAHLTKALVLNYISQYGKPGLIHAHNTFWAGYAAFNIARRLNIPYLVTEHSSRFVLNSVTKRMTPYACNVLSSASSVIGVSSAVSEALGNFGAKTVSTVPNVVDTDYFMLPLSQRQCQPFTFLAIGNMNYNKGFHVLIRAFSEKFRGRQDVRLILGGEGPQREEFKKLSCDLGVSETVIFTGSLGRSGVREELWRANALVLPSFRETFGVVLIEALSTGIPVIAGKSGGPQDVVTPDVGFLFEPGNVKQLMDSMEKLMNVNYSEQALREYAINNFSEKALIRRLTSIYKNVLENRTL